MPSSSSWSTTATTTTTTTTTTAATSQGARNTARLRSPLVRVDVGGGGGRGGGSGAPDSPPRCRLFKPPAMRIPRRPVAAICFAVLSSADRRCRPPLFNPIPSPHRPTLPPPSRGFCRPALNSSMEGLGASEASPLSAVSPAAEMDCGCGGGMNGKVWSSPGGGKRIAMGKRIFCNRSLNMKNIIAVGFDMDYTLAQYKPETFESLAYDGTIKKLVYDLGYPPELLEWTFDWKYMVRGLVLDKKRGNILKMDRHKYVKVAYHGFKELSKEEKISTYGNTLTRDSFDEPDYALIDTLFSLAEAYLFAQLVDFVDKNPEKVPCGVNYGRMYKDVRAAVDLCHRDGTLKQMVAKDPGRYINEDLAIVPMLKMLRDSGRATFLVTNSLWDYTNVVMNYLCRNHAHANGSACSYDWLDNFDVVITGSSKPSFFHEENRAQLFEVEPESGMLLNTDNGYIIPQVGSTSPRLPPKRSCRVFQGGNVAHLHKLLSIASSSQVLYVGDHIYGDILRSKKVLGWRTMLVVPELEQEVELLWHLKDTRKELRQLRIQRDLIEDKIHRLRWSIKFDAIDTIKEQDLSSEVCKLEIQQEEVRRLHQEAQRECHQKFHKVWGQLMKTGYQNSRFAHQVERFACLYSSQVTNLSLYSPDKYYRPSEDFMPHEFEILGI